MSLHLFTIFMFALLFGRSIEYGIETFVPSPLWQSIATTAVVFLLFVASEMVCKRYHLTSVKVKPIISIPALIAALLLSAALHESGMLPG